ncbi:uncharacterized protein K452DRAFT_322848 [Aplosporella prunicola CBS 121167]|uniref:Structural maintenance of chromosomes protein 5 n=1 Tax=Aplosporella prunicola CBS 121167 TaxID=1176127 RepID=A0A6A6AV34_9PEZI|nr:uncharacterized protein K452DRAFT_322848 [Aplosporella prunicola CBS 121167]KAF2135799.1 hypothetical protein K452DRAFT_322848 [Aplosporella prunicola CBS 121167]
MARVHVPSHKRTSDDFEEDIDGESADDAQAARAKRPRVEHSDESEPPETPVLPESYRSRSRENDGPSGAPLEHQPGSIVRVKLTNFVTYTAAEFNLGPSLNMIIGPNGTGKSTLVCAICLGLGWGPQHLGRAKELGEFVKHGAREAEIEIELAGGQQTRGRNPIIRRLIKKEGNKTSFSLNGSQSTAKEIARLCKSFSIQIDNLCQFLPQDRVVEFAALSPIQLLEHTQRAAAPEQMNEWHAQLKQMRSDQKQKQATTAAERETLANFQNRQNAQRADVERLQERQTLVAKVKAYENLRPLVHYRVIRTRHDEAKQRQNDAQAELRELEQEVAPILSALKDKQKYHQEVTKVAEQRRKLVLGAENRAGKLQSKHKELHGALEDLDKEKETERNADNERKAELKRVDGSIRTIQNQMKHEPPEFDAAAFNERIRERARAIRDLEAQEFDERQKRQEHERQLQPKESQRHRLHAERENLKSQQGQQANKLRGISKDTAVAWEWIQNNKQSLRGEVFGPPIISCSVQDPRYASAVETFMQKGDYLAFTCTNRQDFNMLGRKFSQEMNLRDFHLKEAIKPMSHWRGQVSNEHLQHCGLSGWLIDFISGPEPVLSALCDTRGIHRTGVTLHEHNDEQYERLLQSPISQWVAGRAAYSVSRRREYGAGAVSTTVRELRAAMYWTNQPVDTGRDRELVAKTNEISHDLEMLQGVINECRQKETELRQRKSEAQHEKDSIEHEKNALQKARADFEGLHTRLETQMTKRDSLRERGASTRRRLYDIEAKADNMALRKSQAALDYSTSVQMLLKVYNDMLEVELIRAEAQSEVEILEARNEDVTQTLETRKQEVNALKQEVKQIRGQARRLVEEVKRIQEERSEEEEELVQDIQETISEEDLESEIESFRGRLGLLHDGNPHVIAQYEKRARDIGKLEDKLRGMDAELEELQQEIDSIKAQWEPELDALVQKISDAFSFNFNKIGCAGQVGIYKAEDFDQWAIQIQVKFREQEQLSLLDSHRQSGGERAVSTIFYLMALQSLARSPFRVVDEINQGMDPRNERMVHERMVDIACQEHTSQYFLITPKLLHGLRFHPRMKVHCIASGEYMPEDYRRLDFRKLMDTALRVRGKA